MKYQQQFEQLQETLITKIDESLVEKMEQVILTTSATVKRKTRWYLRGVLAIVLTIGIAIIGWTIDFSKDYVTKRDFYIQNQVHWNAFKKIILLDKLEVSDSILIEAIEENERVLFILWDANNTRGVQTLMDNNEKYKELLTVIHGQNKE